MKLRSSSFFLGDHTTPSSPRKSLSEKACIPEVSHSNSLKKHSEKGGLISPRAETIPSIGSGEGEEEKQTEK